MDDLSDDFFAMAAGGKMTAAEADEQALVRLKRDHAQWSRYADAKDVAAAEASLAERLDEVGAKGWSFDASAEPADPKAKADLASNPVVADLDAVKNHFEIRAKAAINMKNGLAPKAPDWVVDEIMNQVDWHKRHGSDNPYGDTIQDLYRQGVADALAAINAHEAQKSLRRLKDAGLDTLYSHLDGIPRKGVRSAGASVSQEMSAQVKADVAPFLRELVDTGLDAIWVGNSAEAVAARGVMIRSLVNELKFGGTKDPLIKRLAETLRMTKEVQVGRMNARGANIRLLEGHAFSQVHNAAAVRGNIPEFIQDLMSWVDWEATRRSVGPNMPDGTFNARKYAEAFAHELTQKGDTTADFDIRTMGGNLANRVSRSRTLHFKETFAVDYDMKYGSGNTTGLIVQQIVKRSEQGTVMQHFGPDYKTTWQALMSDMGRSKVWGFSKLARIDLTFQHLTGDLNHPASATLAATGQAVRNSMNAATLWMSGISSLTDLGNATSTMKWMGMNASQINQSLYEAMKAHAAKGPKERQFLMAHGAGLEALVNAFSRTQAVANPWHRLAEKLSDVTFKYNGQELWTKTLQSAFHDLSSQHLGQMARVSGKLPDEFRNWLGHYGISEVEWKRISEFATEIEGLDGVRVAADLITEPGLAKKLRTAMEDSMHFAVMAPSVSDNALLTLGTRAGTPFGEAVRAVMQYKSYPLTMIRRQHRRFEHAYGNASLEMFGTKVDQGTIAKVTWASAMLSLGFTVLAIKDVLRGREPLNPFDTEQWTIGNASRVVTQAGVGPLAVVDQFFSPRQLLGPAPGAAFDFTTGALSGNGYKATNSAIGAMPFSSIAPLREAQKALFGSIFVDTYGVGYQNGLRMIEAERGQTSIFLDNPGPQN